MPSPGKTKKSNLKYILFAFIAIPLAFVVLIEVLLHGLYFAGWFPDYPGLKTRLQKNSYETKAELVYEDNVARRTPGIAPVYGKRGIPPQRIEFAKDGMRIDAYDGEAKCVVGVFGDSYSDALQVGQLEDYSSIAETSLRQAGFDVNFKNFGLGRLGTTGAYLRHNQLVDKGYRFDYVILQFFPGNDVRNNSKILNAKTEHKGGFAYFVMRDGQLVRDDSTPKPVESHIFPVREVLAKYSHLANLLHNTRKRVSLKLDDEQQFQSFNPNPDPLWQDAWTVTETVLRKWAQESKASGSDFKVLMVTSHAQLTDRIVSHGFQRDYPNQRIGKVAQETGAGYLDILPIALDYIERTKLEPPYLSWEHDGHYSQLGHRLVADALTEFLRDRLLPCKS